jgi:hypothetical protein
MQSRWLNLWLMLLTVSVAPLYAAEDPTLISNRPGYERFYPRSITVADGLLYAASVSAGFQVYDVSELSAPTRIGSFDGEDAGVLQVAVSGTNAFVAYGSAGVLVFGITNPRLQRAVSTNSPYADCVVLKAIPAPGR